MRIWEFSKPVIGAINGWTMGAGSWLACFTHITIASEDAVFAQPEVRHGSNTSFMWTLLAGFKNALRYGLTGDHVALIMDDQLSGPAHVMLREELRRPLDEARLNEGTRAYLKLRDGPFQPEPFGPKSRK